MLYEVITVPGRGARVEGRLVDGLPEMLASPHRSGPVAEHGARGIAAGAAHDAAAGVSARAAQEQTFDRNNFV